MHASDDIFEFVRRTGNLFIHLLDRCNLHCEHCYLNAHPNGNRLLPLDLVRRTLEEADKLGFKSIQLSGGEPLLHPNFREVLQSTIGRNFAVTVSTNGTLIDEESANLLAQAHARVVTSIDGPELYHDQFRGKTGSFAGTKKGIARLVQRGITVEIVTTISTESTDYINWCAEWAVENGAKTLQFQPLQSIGRGKAIKAKRLQQEALQDLFIELNDLAVRFAPRGLNVEMTYKSREFMIAHPCTAFVCNGKKCHRGVEKELKNIVVREDGAILPELVDIDRRFTIGNLFDDNMENHLRKYLKDGYAQFDQLCREAYRAEVINSAYPLIPWTEILTERSRQQVSVKTIESATCADARMHNSLPS